MKNPINIVIAGVGGQGTLVAGKLFGAVAIQLGLDVKVSEIHGMSQRGGSVVTFARIGEQVWSPVIEKGSADYVLAFEELEALRCAGFLKEGGRMIVNRQNIVPVTVRIGKGHYPDDIPAKLQAAAGAHAEILPINAEDMAYLLGNTRTVNMIMIGAMSVYTGISTEIWEAAISEVLPARLHEINLKAFRQGVEFVTTKK
jgi:indolepyruvate ferredoxin oxidoreductase, beta subunit